MMQETQSSISFTQVYLGHIFPLASAYGDTWGLAFIVFDVSSSRLSGMNSPRIDGNAFAEAVSFSGFD